MTQALDAAWARFPQAAALSARQAQARAGVDLSRGLTPGAASVSLNHLNDRLNQNTGRREWEIEMATPLWLPGQRRAREVVADLVSAEVEARGAALRLELASEVREAWWAVAVARESTTLARQKLATAQALESTVQRRFKTGDLARLDANLAKTERLAAQAEVLDADSASQLAQQAYRVLVGLEAPTVLAPEGEAPQEVDAPHPQLRALQLAAEVARSRLALVDASQRDAPELAVRWSNQRSDALAPHDQAVGVKLTIPLSSGGQVRQEEAAARAELAQAEAELAQMQTRTQQNVLKAQAEWSAAQRQMGMAEERKALTADSLQLAQRAFEVGESDLPALMRARAASQEALAWSQRQEVARHLALSRLHQARGVMP
ncbi:TolC family protein [Aquabacterium sp.]|uniref:TolC family protein n=1 Tax=Aquabacterium sp. TaxID=1872578 RepID=UPI00248A2B3B|nr:TolC family protein [Aquabacterium sp.]MDI1261115.1 TolC family protein [Aquabacterium sp.]